MRLVAAGLCRLLLCAAALLPSAAAAAAAAEPHWEYSGEFGPAHWGSMRAEFSLCDRGQKQSPIDIVSTRRQSLPPLQFDYRSQPSRAVNDGHTVRVHFGIGSRLLIGGQPHRLQQFHFHIPGGDRVHGEEFPMAMHFLHKGADGRLVSLVVLFRLGAENRVFGALLPKLPMRGMAERRLPDTMVDPAALVPTSHGYYAYDGSLTAPPCTEGVRWIVMKQPLELSAAQLEQLGQLFPNNARPVQPLHKRIVIESL